MDLRSNPRDDLLVSLPAELQFEIFKYLDTSDLLKSRRVCKRWNERLSSYKELWTELCALNGIVYSEREIIENPEKYKIFFLRMKSRVEDIKLGQCFSLESVPPRSEDNYFRLDMQAFHCYEFKICVATMEGLIYVFDQNRSPVRTLQINIIDFVSRPCRILSLRLDDTNVAVLEQRGVTSIWDVNDGHFVASYHITEDVFCFDLLKGTLTVACGLRGYVKIVDVIRSEDILVEISIRDVSLQVVLTRHWLDNLESQHQIFLLFCMNNYVVTVHEIRNFFSADEAEVKSATLLHKIDLLFDQLFHQCVLPYVPSFCYDDWKYLYFPRLLPNNGTSIISQLNVSTGEYKDIILDLPVHELLGAGKMSLVLTSADNGIDHASLHAIDPMDCDESRFTYPLASDVPVETGCYDSSGRFIYMGGRIACICQRSWLDGLNGFNDEGYICVYRHTYRSLRLVRWSEETEDP